MPDCNHPKPLANIGHRSNAAKTPAARAWCPACGADTDWIDGTKPNALAVLAKIRPAAKGASAK